MYCGEEGDEDEEGPGANAFELELVAGLKELVEGMGTAVELLDVVVQDMVDCLGGRPVEGRDGIKETKRRESNLWNSISLS